MTRSPDATPDRRVPGRLLVALGGNAIQRAHDHGSWQESVRQMRRTARALAAAVGDGTELIVTHGNGPQVGRLLREAELGAAEVPVPPLHVIDAESQGQIGYLIGQELTDAFARTRRPRTVLPIVSRVEVSARDPAFHHPSKPVGRFYPAREARALQARFGWTMQEDRARGGWRRLVPSPRPIRWVEAPSVRALLDAGAGARTVFLVTGGGGIPVVRSGGRFVGIDAVIDKDRTAACVGEALGAATLAIVTDVPGAAVGFRKGRPRWLGEVGYEALTRYWEDGEFAEGSMGPKVEAGLEFLRRGGERLAITDPPRLRSALEGRAGTRVVAPRRLHRAPGARAGRSTN